MNHLIKYIVLFCIFFISILTLFYYIDNFKEKGIELQKQILLKQAQTHFSDQKNTRKWNANYGGVYVKPLKNQEPNPYLLNNTLKVNENLTLIRINPAWMTRQLSELSNEENFHFRIVSLIPINRSNKTTLFEKEALEYFEEGGTQEYYELGDDSKFNYMGALPTAESCLPCHAHHGYVLGDIRGGISITLDSSEYETIVANIKSRAIALKILTIVFLLSITLLIFKQFRHSEKLQSTVDYRTKEIESTKQLLQQIIDTDASFIILTHGSDVVYVNKTILNLTGDSSLEEFKESYGCVSDFFDIVEENDDFLQAYNNGLNWIEYLKQEQDLRDLKVLVTLNKQVRYFRPYAKEISTDDKILYLVKFDEITNEYEKIQELEHKASIDSLTKLFNRSKLNDVLEKEMDLAHAVLSPLSIIFLDIDYFKLVNDTYGHDVGDRVLIELADIITSTVRTGDFAARWGGEEFMITLQASDVKNASILAQKLRVAVEEFSFDTVGKLSISLGVTEYIDNESEDDFLKRVDKALYEAKAKGRNMVVVK